MPKRFSAWLCLVALNIAAWSEGTAAEHGDPGQAVPPAVQSAPKAEGPTSERETIQRRIRERHAAAGVQPAAQCSDESFVRRAYLDLVGRIPTTAERSTFLADQRPEKREALVDVLLASEDFVQHFTDLFDTLMMGRVPKGKYDERNRHWRPYLENVFRQNRPWDQVAREILLARPTSESDRGSVWFIYERNDNAQAIAEAIAPSFFGIRIDCAQCHDHMIAAEIHQQHYWGLVAFFNRGKNQKTKHGPRVAESAIGGFSEFANLQGSSSPNLLTFFESKQIDEARPEKDAKQEDSDDLYREGSGEDEPRVPKFSRREKFVDEILKNHPLFAPSMVNRIWAILLGRGIVHPFDQMNSAHPPSHPELLQELAEGFRASGYDIRRLIRAIATSEPYQLSSIPPDGSHDPALFTHYLERPLTAEQLARSIQVGMRGSFVNHHPLAISIRERMPDVLPETTVTNIGETLFWSNNPTLNQYLDESAGSDGFLSSLTRNERPNEAVDALYTALLGREPDDEERRIMVTHLEKSSGEERDAARNASGWKQLAWALMTTAEFRYNH